MMRRTGLSLSVFLIATSVGAQADAQDATPQNTVVLPTLILGSALRTERSVLDTPVSVTVLDSEELQSKQATDFEELIGEIPGLSIGGGPRGISQEPNIRGFQDEQIVLRFDGGRFNFSQAHRGRFFIDPELIQQVEVVRGGGSTLYGSGALGGVLSFDTKDAADLLAPGETSGVQVTTGFSTNGEVGRASATFFGQSGGFDYLAFLGTRQFGADLDSGNGTTIRNSQIDLVNGMLKLGFEPTSDQRFEFNLSRYGDDGTTPANSSDVSGGTQDVNRAADVSMLRLSYDYSPEGSDLVDLSVLFYGNTTKITEDRISDARADRTEYDTWGFEVVNQSRFDLGVPVSVVYGFEAFEDTQTGVRNGVARPQFPDAEARTVGLFAEAIWEATDRLDIITGLRYDNYRRNPGVPALADVEEDFTSPRIGFSFRPSENWQVYGNVARAFRAPSLSELYNDGTHFTIPSFPLGPGQTATGVNRFIPNPDLEPEASTQIELGARFQSTSVFRPDDQLSFNVSAYRADVDDYIDSVVSIVDFATATPGPGGLFIDGTTRTRNIDAKLYGLETEVNYDTGDWYAGGGLSIARGEESGSNEALGSIPQDRLTLQFGWRPNSDWDLGIRTVFAAEQSRVPTGGVVGPSYEVVDLFATWRPQSVQFAETTIRFGVDNLFDEQYAIYPNGLAQPGRTFKVSSTFRF